MTQNSSLQNPCIFTFGYGNRKDYSLFSSYLETHQVRYVIDVRMSPRAWSRRWYGEQVKIFCESQDIQYISKTELGNTSGKKDWIPPDRQQADDALQEVAEIARKNAILLLCSEMNPQRCHRMEVSKSLSDLIKANIIHLE
jgi:uncharacterized protein (DUF488 family)